MKKGILILKKNELSNLKLVLPPEISDEKCKNCKEYCRKCFYDIEEVLPTDSEIFLQTVDEIRKEK